MEMTTAGAMWCRPFCLLVGGPLSLRELERAAGTFTAVLLSLLHPAVAREVAGVAEFLGDSTFGRLTVSPGRGGCFPFAKHRLERAGHTLRGSAGLASDATAADVDEHVQAVAHIKQRQRPGHGAAVFFLGEELLDRPVVDHNLAVAFRHPDTGHGGLPPAGSQVELLRRAQVRLPQASL